MHICVYVYVFVVFVCVCMKLVVQAIMRQSTPFVLKWNQLNVK